MTTLRGHSTDQSQISKPHVIVLGNEKGGSGKSTTGIHIAVALLKRGFTVGCLDLDARQASLTRYLENRRNYMEQTGVSLDMPTYQRVPRSRAATQAKRDAEETHGFGVARAELGPVDFLLIDTPGSDSFLSRLGHSHADTLVTPLNDSFLDLDVLARIDSQSLNIVSPSVYSQMVWEQRQRRASADMPPIDWIVMRNRLTHIDAKSKRDMAVLLDQLAQRIGFRVFAGFGERVIYRDLFLKGLTLFDLRDVDSSVSLSISHVAARQEVRTLVQALGLPEKAPKQAAPVIPEESAKVAQAGTGLR